MSDKEIYFKWLLRLADNSLIMGQRLSEWCGHGPVLEQDIALANIALDHIGQSRSLLTFAGNAEGKGRTEDDLAFHRDEREFYNNLIVELPNHHFGFTIMKQYFFDVYQLHYYTAMLQSNDEELGGFAAKSLKEVKYHVRHSREWMLRLGDGTRESHKKMQDSLNELWEFTGDLFDADDIDKEMHSKGIAPDLEKVKEAWEADVHPLLEEATLEIPDTKGYMHSGSRKGYHTEYLGYILAEMQHLPRTMPDATW